MYDIGIYMGRFQPFHRGHEECIRKGLEEAKELIIVIGSVDQPVTFKNPFSYEQRYRMIWTWIQEEDLQDRVKITYLKDIPMNDMEWSRNLYGIAPRGKTVGLVTHDKGDGSSDWIKLMGWGLINADNYASVDATSIREAMYEDKELKDISKFTYNFIQQFKVTDEFYQAREEYLAKLANDEAWKDSPYTPIFVTTDTIVVNSKHEILLVKRKGPVGKGLWALPGGYLEPNLTLEENAKKELEEETSVLISEEFKLWPQMVVDTPNRSLMGRIITHVFLYIPQNDPQIKAGDDAAEVAWVPMKDIKENMMFEDHYHIINKLL